MREMTDDDRADARWEAAVEALEEAREAIRQVRRDVADAACALLSDADEEQARKTAEAVSHARPETQRAVVGEWRRMVLRGSTLHVALVACYEALVPVTDDVVREENDRPIGDL